MESKQPNILIKQALSYAANEVNGGLTPTEALKKTAEFYDLNYNYVQRVGEALNTALYQKHFKTASDQSSVFPIADISLVNDELYNENEKTANHFVSEQFPSSQLFNPIPDLDKIYTNPKYKEAYLKISSVPEDPKVPLSDKALYEKTSSYIKELEKQALNANMKSIESKNNMESIFFQIANNFKKDAGYRTSFEEFESQAFAKHGEKALPYLDLMYKHANLKEERGIHDSGYLMFTPCKELSQLDKFFKYSEEMLTFEKEAEDAEYNVKFEKEYLTEIHKKKEINKEAGLLDTLSGLFENDKKEQQKKPSHGANEEMQNFERQALLQELLITDPILSKESPHKVIAAYEQIVRIAPAASLSKDTVRALLRQLVAGQAMAPHSANQMVEFSLNLMKQKAMEQGNFGSNPKS